MRQLLSVAVALAIATPALANDSTATTAAGGLVLQHTDAIDMASEDLFVSVDQIRIHYVFRNRAARDVTTIIAFPMPDRDLSVEFGGDVAFPSKFRTSVGGQPIEVQLERKAVFKGKDYTALLKQLGIPIAPDSINDATKAMDRLPPAQRRKLQALGLAGDEEYSDSTAPMQHHAIPLWTVKDKYWWTQRFLAERDLVIDHSYIPGAGGSVDSMIAFRQFRNTKDTKQEMARYCMDRDFITAVDKRSAKDSDGDPRMPDRKIDYILKTGANWRSPIGSFRLVVDKGKPGNLLSFCETGIKKISPTQFEVRHSNWTPTRDLHVLIIEPQS